MDLIFDSLNDQQIKAVSHKMGPALVVAGPGSGKTRVLTHRVAYLLNEFPIEEFNILCVTFTNKAANEIKQRVRDLIGTKSLSWSGTFHSVCSRILRKEGFRIGIPISFVIYDTDDQQILIKQIMKELPLPQERQTMLFSATMAEDIANMATKYIRTPVRVEVARAGTVAEQIDQEIYFVSKDQKSKLLNELLQKYTGSVLIFTRTKYGAKKVCKDLNTIGIRAAEIHSNRSLYQRKEALEGFKKGKYSVLVATDIASRGIDVKGIQLIVNYDLPEDPEDYVHRIGRTGRAGESGKAISMATHDQRGKIHRIEILTKTKLKVIGKEPPQSSKKPKPYSREKEQEFFKKRHFVNKRRFGGNKPFRKKQFGK